MAIYYTTDGTIPTVNSRQYSVPLTLNTTTTFKYFAIDEPGNSSPVTTEVYTIDVVPPTLNITSLSNGITNNNGTFAYTIVGTANDNTRVGTLFINGVTVPFDRNGNFNTTVLLSNGATAITSVATDIVGNKSTDTTMVDITVLTTRITGSGAVNNINQPPVFSCATSSCTDSFKYGTDVTLHATPASLYTFTGWSGMCSGVGVGDCEMKITSNVIVSATFDRMALVQVMGAPAPYYDLQAAYDATGNNAEFSVRDITFNGDFTLDKSSDIILNGGLDSDFTTVSGVTTIHGVLRINAGKLIVKRLRVH